MSSLSSAAHRARQRNLLFFSSPHLWPEWPVLPIVRRKVGKEEECGILYDLKEVYGLFGYSATVFICNVFQMPRTLDEFLALPKEVYDTAEELADAGWTVD